MIDDEWIFDVSPLPQDYWLFHNNPKINLGRLLAEAKPKKVIIDGSNSPYYIDRWSTTLSTARIPYHITSKSGAVNLSHENEE